MSPRAMTPVEMARHVLKDAPGYVVVRREEAELALRRAAAVCEDYINERLVVTTPDNPAIGGARECLERIRALLDDA